MFSNFTVKFELIITTKKLGPKKWLKPSPMDQLVGYVLARN